MRKLLVAVLVVLSIIQVPLQAAYLTKVPQTLKQPDGTTLKCYATGDEFHSWLHDANDYTIIQNPETGYYVYAAKSGTRLVATSWIAGMVNPAAVGLQPGLNLDPKEILSLSKSKFQIPKLKGTSGVATTGSINNIAIFIRFSDQQEYSNSLSAFNSAFNGSGDVSMDEYFKEVSGDQLSVTTSFYPGANNGVVVSYQDANPRNYYCKYNASTNPIGYQTDAEAREREMVLLKEAVNALKSEIEASGLNFDNDGNKQIDNICFIVKGGVGAWGDLLWPHMCALYLFDVSIAGCRVWNYNFQISSVLGVSVLCHEMSHSISYPDLYRYYNRNINPVGQWDIMSLNANPPQHQDVYTKLKYGQWLTSIPEISTPGTYSLEPLSTNPFAAYKIASPNSTTEFFVLEYRSQSGLFESGLPGSGLIIYRVNTLANGNENGPVDEIYVFRPGGKPGETTADNGNISQAFFSAGSGRVSFNAADCFLSNGTPGGIEITDIGTAGETISFRYRTPVTSPELTVKPETFDMVFGGGATSFAVSNTGVGTMTWTATVTAESASWVHITGGSSGTNAGTINVSVGANSQGSLRTGIITVTSSTAGTTGSPKILTIRQAANPPVLNVSPSKQSIAKVGGNTDFVVTNSGGGSMPWTATTTSGGTWCHILSGASGTNTGTIEVSADANGNSSVRYATITVTAAGISGSPQTITVEQSGTSTELSVGPDSQNVDFTGGTTTFAVSNTGSGTMPWTAAVTIGASWIQITSGAAGSNSGTITASVSANPDGNIRTGEITVIAPEASSNPKIVRIIQSGNPPVLCVLPATRSLESAAGATTFEVTNTGAGTMSWTAEVTSGNAFVHITSGASGTNTGTLHVNVDANSGDALRTGTIAVTFPGNPVGSKIVNIVQAPSAFILNVGPDNQNVAAGSSSTTFAVSNNGGGSMIWTAAVTDGSSWAHISSGAAGNNDGIISVSVEANPDNAIRVAEITVTAPGAANSPGTVHISQAANTPVFNVLPSSRSLDFVAGSTTFSVSNTGGGTLSWSAVVTTGNSWAHITNGAAGSSNGTISVSADPNPDNAERIAIITVSTPGTTGGPVTISVVQAPNPPVLTLSPLSQIIAFSAGTVTFEVNNLGGNPMNWTAKLPDEITWARILNGFYGINSGTITVEIDQNVSEMLRSLQVFVEIEGIPGSTKMVNIDQLVHSSGISLLKADNSFKVYPNPTRGMVTIQIPEFRGIACKLQVLNMVGALQMVQVLTRESTNIDLSSLSKGVYFFRIIAETGEAEVIRVIKD